LVNNLTTAIVITTLETTATVATATEKPTETQPHDEIEDRNKVLSNVHWFITPSEY
jgi:hypothetical protein